MKNFLKNLWQRRWLRICAWLGITLLTALVLARQYISWSGARRWVAVQEMLAREGESLDLHKIAPDVVPDDKNFCAIPAFKDLPLITTGKEDKSEAGVRHMRLVNAELPKGSDAGPQPKQAQGPTLGRATDMKAWADWLHKDSSLPTPPDASNPASVVIADLSKHDALISEMAASLDRPESQWTPPWKTRAFPEDLFSITLPHYSSAMGLASMLCLRSAAAARAGDADKAHESLLIATRINQANIEEPFLIGTLVACANSAVVCGAVWELCDAHSGTAEDFRKLQEALSRLDYRKSLLYAQRGELAASVSAIAYVKRTRDPSIFQVFDMGSPAPRNIFTSFALRLIPDGWFDANAASSAQWQFNYSIKPLRDAGLKELLTKQKELEPLIAEHKSHIPFQHFDELLAVIAIPVTLGVSTRVAYAQCVVNEAIAACVLERYHIEHNAYPDILEAANHPGEKPIPLDILSGKPMGYRKTPNGKFALWCVGFDGKDDGGKRNLDEKKPENTNFHNAKYVGDWVWDYPES